jgi:outer membrane protein assembly factor BamB
MSPADVTSSSVRRLVAILVAGLLVSSLLSGVIAADSGTTDPATFESARTAGPPAEERHRDAGGSDTGTPARESDRADDGSTADPTDGARDGDDGDSTAGTPADESDRTDDGERRREGEETDRGETPPKEAGPNMTSAAVRRVEAARAAGRERVTLRINAKPGEGDRVVGIVRGRGGEIDSRYRDQVVGRLPLPAVEGLRNHPAVNYIQLPVVPEPTTGSIVSEGIYNVTADEVHTQGYTGDGVVVAVIDLSFDASNPEIAPNVVGTKEMTSGKTFANTSGAHGTAVAEIVADTAPDVSLVLIDVDTVTEWLNAYDYAESVGADVTTASLGIRFGPFDGTGPLGDEIGQTRANGTISFVSAGNAGGGKHLNRTWTDPDGDDVLNFDGSDEELGVSTAASRISVAVSWNDYPSSDQDYDVYLYDSNGDVLDSSLNVQDGTQAPEEFVATDRLSRCPCHLEIEEYSASGTADFDLFANDGTTLEYSTSARSVTRPATDESAFTVGAVDFHDLTLEGYSSRGPTIDGRRKPEALGPAQVSTSIYGPEGFFGTSAAAPHAAGVAALLVDANQSLRPGDLDRLLTGTARQTDPNHDSPDPNNRTGHGLLDADAALTEMQSGSAPLAEEWSFDAGSRFQYASAAVGADRVYLGGLDDTVYALDRATGAVAWQFDRSGSLVDSSPTLDDGRVFVGSGAGGVYALWSTNGTVDWRTPTDSAVVSSPTVAGGTVYVGSNDGTVWALDAATGAVQWTAEVNDSVLSTPAVDGGTAYVTTDDGRLIALDAADGSTEWTHAAATEVGRASPAVSGTTVYFAADSVYAIDPADGSVRWQTSYGGTAGSTPVVDGGTVYVGSAGGSVLALDGTDGAVQWTFATGDAVGSTPTVVSDRVVVGSDDGYVYLLDAATGAEVARTRVGRVRSSAPVANDVAFVGTWNGTLYALGNVTSAPATSTASSIVGAATGE